MRLFIIISLFSSCLNADINYALKVFQNDNSTVKRQKLLKAIALTVKTNIGKKLKPYINELMQQDKIQLSGLYKGHYGESGEGCVIKSGNYFYEGYFILLNDKLSTAELASALVHEISHYHMIKQMVDVGYTQPVKVSTFEISAFATQYEFIKELEQLKLVHHQSLFIDENKIISKIIYSAYKLRTNWSEISYDAFLKQLIDYGYPYTELNRTISQRTEKQCVGLVKSNSLN
ncbi:MAG: hypothetical protein L3J75_11220 [Methylococcaceae bacterium]|nr:hypothetical protein [Methylococcaceae bacterium]